MELFDLHSDTIVLWKERGEDFYSKTTHFSLNEQEHFKRLCQTFAVFVPDSVRGAAAKEYVDVHAAYLREILAKQSDIAEQAYTAEDIERITSERKCACLLAIESGAALAGSLENVSHFARQGVKMMTLVWNGENELGSGHTTHNGLTKFGRAAVREMEKENILVDISHLNDEGFEDVCEIAEKPFIATHSNMRSICSHKRNLTERQFGEMVRRGGLVGINLYESFLDDRNEGTMENMFRHVYRMLELGGEDVIACGSDFDGAEINEELNSPRKFAGAAEYLMERGIPEHAVRKMYFENALRFYKKMDCFTKI